MRIAALLGIVIVNLLIGSCATPMRQTDAPAPSALLPSSLIGPEQRQTGFFRGLASPDAPHLCHSVGV